jgi:hypothetical protein
LVNSYVIFYRPKKEIIHTMENISVLMMQARAFMAQNQDFIPLHHVEEVAMYGNVDTYVVACGVDINTQEGSDILNWEAALYLVCRQLCDMGAGNRPFQPHPYLRDPVIVQEEEEVADDIEVAGDQVDDPPDNNMPDPVFVAPPHPAADDGVRIVGPLLGHELFQPPMVYLPPGDPVNSHGELPKPKPESKSRFNSGGEEYVEPNEEKYGGLN